MRGLRLAVAIAATLLALGSGMAVAERQGQGGEESESSPELRSMRTATSKTFELPDGRLETRLFENPVHYRGAERQWQPIGEGLEEQADGSGLTNGANRFDLSLPERMGAAPVRIAASGAWVAARLLEDSSDPVELDGAGKTAIYGAADSQSSFDLSTLANGVKEDIVIASPGDPNHFSFELTASQGLHPVLTGEGSIEFRDGTGKAVIVLPQPSLSDDSGRPAPPDAARYELERVSEGAWRLSVEADRSWLSAPGRSFPAYLDPTMVTPSPGLDCMIGGTKEGEPVNWGTCGSNGKQELLTAYWAEEDPEEEEWQRSLFRFGLGAVPSGAEVESATFEAHSFKEARDTEGIELRETTKPWDEEATWTEYDEAEHPWSTEGGDYGEADLSEVLTSERGNQVGWWDFSLSPETIEGLVSGEEDLSFIAKLIDDKDRACDEEGCTHRVVRFDSSAAEDEEDRPYLSLVYSVPTSEGPIAAYSFDEGSGETAHDDSGNGHDGAIHGAEWREEGKYGSALHFDAPNDDFLAIPDADALDFAATAAFTLEAWINLDEERKWAPLFAKTESEEPNFSYLVYAPGNVVPKAELKDTEGETANVWASEALPIETWSHLAATSDGEDLRIYVDGELIDTEPAVVPRNSEADLRIGGNEQWGEHFDGLIDNVRIYDHALSAEEIATDMFEKPTVATGEATDLSAEEATLHGTVNPNGLETTYQFEYGTTTEYGEVAPASPEGIGSGTEAKAASETIEGLEPGTTYHYRITAQNDLGASWGKDQNFTAQVPPDASTLQVANVNDTVATLSASINPNGTNTTYYFDYGSTPSYGQKVPTQPEAVGDGIGTVPVDQLITGLEDGKTYHYRVVAINSGGTSYGSDKSFTVDLTSPTMTFKSDYIDGSTSEYELTIQANDPGAYSTGVQRIDILLNGEVEESLEQTCSENQCPSTTEETWNRSFDHSLTGQDHLMVIAVDQANNNSSSVFDLPSEIVKATVYTQDPAEGGTQISDEWAQLYTHNGKTYEPTQTVTRGNALCANGEDWCSYLRSIDSENDFSEAVTPINQPEDISEAGTLLLPSQPDFGEVISTGIISEIAEPWQTLPPNAGTNYEMITSKNEASEPEGQLPQPGGEWSFWIDTVTKLPIKSELAQEGEPTDQFYYSYSGTPLEAGDLSPSFFLLNEPTRQEKGCVESGQLGGWEYNPAGFSYPDPRFASIVQTASGPMVVRPEGAAADGYDQRAVLTEDGVELNTDAADQEELHWEFTQSTEQTLETAGEDIVVVSGAGVASAIIEPTGGGVEVVDGEPNLDEGASGDEVVLEPTEAGTSADIESVGSEQGEPLCVTQEMISQAAVVHEEAEESGVVLEKPESSKTETTQVKIWVNPHPALASVSVTDKYGSCNGPNPKTFGSDGYVIFGGCPIGKSVTFTVPHVVTAGGLEYIVPDSSRTIKPPSYGWTISFNYTAQTPPPPPQPEEEQKDFYLQFGWGHEEVDDTEAEASSGELAIPPGLDCFAKHSAPWRTKSAIIDQWKAKAQLRFRCRATALLVAWWVKWQLARWVKHTDAPKSPGEWKVRAQKEPSGPGPAVITQGPFYIGTECRHLHNLLVEPEKLWRSEGTVWGLAEYPNRVVYGLGPDYDAYPKKGKRLHCE